MRGAAAGIDETTTIPDTRDGREARVLVAGFAEMLASAVKAHEPLARIFEIKEALDDALNRAIAVTLQGLDERN